MTLSQAEASPPTILIVEDDLQFQVLLSKYLSIKGYNVVVANNGEQGIETFRSCQPDLIITDIVMPEIEGVAMIQQIRAIDADTPVIAISGGSSRFSEDYLLYAEKFGANEQVSKPFELDDLLQLVRKHLRFN